MLKEYQISNFKAFAGPETLPIKPITLIFGPNSSGKSSILQSLLMLKQTLDEATDPNTILLFKGSLVDLGSYREFVHSHDVSRTFSFKVTMTKPIDLEDVFPCDDYVCNCRSLSPDFNELKESCTFDTIGINIAFSYNTGSRRTTVSGIELFLGDNPAPIITYGFGKPAEIQSSYVYELYSKSPESFLTLKKVNKEHEYWTRDGKISIADIQSKLNELEGDFRSQALELIKSMGFELDGIDATLVKQPVVEIPDYLCKPDHDFLQLKNYLPDSLNGSETQYIIHEDFDNPNSSNISLFVLAVSNVFRQFLKEVEYIGPLRSYPDRYFAFSGVETQYVGKTGSYVPDILISSKDILAKLNEQFTRFGVGYELKVDNLSSQYSGIQDLFALRLHEKSTGVYASITDVGFGVSQVLPIIVQSLISRDRRILIEQPELHLHPRLQAELGDLFITSALGESKNTLIIETHSEHLILRLLRRIRETTEGKLEEGQLPITPDDLAVVYAKPTEEGTRLIHLRVTEDGDFADPWPDGFFADREKELF